jgi:Protein phosphatase 2C
MTFVRKHVWSAVAASCTGASHQTAGSANQDAYATLTVDGVTVVAVADGHGDPSHFRSRHGARMAVDVAVELTSRAALGAAGPQDLHASLERQVMPQVVIDWRRNVLDHVRSDPIVEDGKEKRVGSGDQALVRAYGTTLIALVATPTALGIAQIGDGDAVAAFVDGGVIRPLPDDPALDGIHTSSLSQVDAVDSMRVSVLDLDARSLALALAVTDGFAAPQVDGVGWWRQVGDQLATHLREHGSRWIREKLPGWLEEPARTGGDDTTMAILLNAALEPTRRQP